MMYIFILIIFSFALFVFVMKWEKEARRNRLRNTPVKKEWVQILQRNLPIYNRLPNDLKKELHGHMQVFIHEKNFEGCGGLKLTEEIKVTIAAQACMLLLNRKTAYYPKLTSILIYPSAFIAKDQMRENGFVQNEEIHLGESWHTGMLVLSWDNALRGALDPRDGHNVVMHEFAHQLDQEGGVADGSPIHETRSRYTSWARVFGEEFVRLQQRAFRGKKSILDYYGAKNPAEFFAVATETFFEKPRPMKQKHPELYEELKGYYKVDPAVW
jgi:Mlc titration factor MtfA (ptsG expression regulator)